MEQLTCLPYNKLVQLWEESKTTSLTFEQHLRKIISSYDI